MSEERIPACKAIVDCLEQNEKKLAKKRKEFEKKPTKERLNAIQGYEHIVREIKRKYILYGRKVA